MNASLPHSRQQRVRLCNRVFLAGACVLATSAVAGNAAPAKGPMGPSAKSAARLKQSPPSAWMAHYLPDDRYKFGAAWQFVTTNLDTYYHRPQCPSMLRQPADNVTGFANTREAEEAGYAPDRSCVHSPLALTAASFGMGGTSQPVTGAMTLANGTARITLPSGWKRTKSEDGSFIGINISHHTLADGKGGRMVLEVMDMAQFVQMARAKQPSMKVPDFSEAVKASRFKQTQGPWSQRLANWQNSSRISSASNEAFGNMQRLNRPDTVADRKIGGWNGIVETFKNGPQGMRRAYVAGKGTKLFYLADFTGRGNAAETVIKSLTLQ